MENIENEFTGNEDLDTGVTRVAFSKSAMKEIERNRRRKRRRITYWILVISFITLLLTASTLTRLIFGADSWIHQAALDNSLDVRNIANLFTQGAGFGVLLQMLATTFIVFLIIKLSWLVTSLLSKGSNNRRKTIMSMLQNFVKYTCIIVLFFILLGMLGVPIGTLVAGAGVIGIIIGFGTQSLLADILSGVFIIFENSFQVGDIITFNNFRGEVEHIGIRTTKIKGVDGNVCVINNSELRVVINMSQYRSFAVCDITIDYTEDLARVEKLINTNLDRIAEKLESILEGPKYIGPFEFSERGVGLRIVAQCEEVSRLQLNRDLNREFRTLFDKHDIKIAVPQVHIKTSETITTKK
ncbi:MAG: mechanosensitive ion channel family protein [Firmicutes bacterium]|nr:mechanosensitive ion channel family protein [Bacillota bacterium]